MSRTLHWVTVLAGTGALATDPAVSVRRPVPEQAACPGSESILSEWLRVDTRPQKPKRTAY